MAPPPPPVEELAHRDRDHTCAAGLVFDVYKNGASSDPVRVEMSGGQCETVAAFEAAVSRAVCEDTAACHVRDGAGRRVRRCSELSRNSAEPGVQPGLIPRAYGVRRDMRFVFATEEVGFKRYLPHLQITLTTLAEEPRLFALENFLTEDDASQRYRRRLHEDGWVNIFRLNAGDEQIANPQFVNHGFGTTIRDSRLDGATDTALVRAS